VQGLESLFEAIQASDEGVDHGEGLGVVGFVHGWGGEIFELGEDELLLVLDVSLGGLEVLAGEFVGETEERLLLTRSLSTPYRERAQLQKIARVENTEVTVLLGGEEPYAGTHQDEMMVGDQLHRSELRHSCLRRIEVHENGEMVLVRKHWRQRECNRWTKGLRMASVRAKSRQVRWSHDYRCHVAIRTFSPFLCQSSHSSFHPLIFSTSRTLRKLVIRCHRFDAGKLYLPRYLPKPCCSDDFLCRYS